MMGAALAFAPRMRVVAGQAVADQDPGVVVAQHAPHDLLAAVVNRVQGQLRVREDPQPGALATQPPAGLVGMDHGAVAHRLLQLLVRPLQLPGDPHQGLAQAAGGEAQAEEVAQDPADPAQRQLVVLVQTRGQRQGIARIGGRESGDIGIEQVQLVAQGIVLL